MDFKLTKKDFEKFKKINPKNCLNLNECSFTKFKFSSKNPEKSIFSYFHQMTEDRFFILMNRNKIKEMYENDKMSCRQILNFLIKEKYINKPITNFLKAINNTDIRIEIRDKKNSVKNSTNQMLKNGIIYYKKILHESNINVDDLNNTEIRKIYKSVILSPFYLRKQYDWDIVERKNLTKYDDATKKFVDNYIKTGVYNFEEFFYNKSKTEILLFNGNLEKILGKKIWKYFGKDVIYKELKSFYEKIQNKRRFVKLKHFIGTSKCWNYFGYIDGRVVSSLSEAKIVSILIDNNINVLTNNWYDINNKKYMYDIYLPDYKLYIEFMGMMQNEEYALNIKEKKQFCEDNNFNVIFSENINNILDLIEKNISIILKREIIKPITVVR
jgi:hypothetical protein